MQQCGAVVSCKGLGAAWTCGSTGFGPLAFTTVYRAAAILSQWSEHPGSTPRAASAEETWAGHVPAGQSDTAMLYLFTVSVLYWKKIILFCYVLVFFTHVLLWSLIYIISFMLRQDTLMCIKMPKSINRKKLQYHVIFCRCVYMLQTKADYWCFRLQLVLVFVHI